MWWSDISRTTSEIFQKPWRSRSFPHCFECQRTVQSRPRYLRSCFESSIRIPESKSCHHRRTIFACPIRVRMGTDCSLCRNSEESLWFRSGMWLRADSDWISPLDILDKALYLFLPKSWVPTSYHRPHFVLPQDHAAFRCRRNHWFYFPVFVERCCFVSLCEWCWACICEWFWVVIHETFWMMWVNAVFDWNDWI